MIIAQLIAPPIQPGPIRLPAETLPINQPANLKPNIQQQDLGTKELESQKIDNAADGDWIPKIKGTIPIPKATLNKILAQCRRSDQSTTLKTCAAALTSELTALGYINSRVFINRTPAPGSLNVVLGRLVQININTDEPKLEKIAKRALSPLIGKILILPQLKEALSALQNDRHTGQISGSLGRLGVDPTQAVLTLNLDQAPPAPWQGELSISNDGNGGTGEFRSINSITKNDLLVSGDNLLFFLELNADNHPKLGSTITSLTYTYPFTEQLSATGSFGFSKRQLVEAPGISKELEFRNIQGLGQLSYELYRSNSQRWSVFGGVSISRNDSFLEGKSIPLVLGGGEEGWLRSGYLRLGINGTGKAGQNLWNANIYGLQGLAGFSTNDQLKDLASFGVSPGEARAVGAVFSSISPLTPTIALHLRAAGQAALNELPNALGFNLGSDAGLKGLPGSLISGDSGWLGAAELSWTFWKNQHNAIQLSPFLGMGGIQTTRANLTFDDSIGSGGVVLRWLHGQHWSMELGWADQFKAEDNSGFWNDWLLGNGLYVDLKYRF